MIYHNRNRGFIALMSVLIIGAILLVYVVTIGVSSFFARFGALALENKEVSRGLAEGCINNALARRAGNAGYVPPAGGECVSLGGVCGVGGTEMACKICDVSQSGSTVTVRARAVYQDSYTNVSADAVQTGSGFLLTKWEETATYTGSSCPVP